MIILTIRTDKPEAEIGLYDDTIRLGYDTWLAHRELSETLLVRIAKLLEMHHQKLQSIEGIIVYAGPGSFTGLRIGISVANALAYSLEIAAVSTTGDNWIESGHPFVEASQKKAITPLVPMYGAPVHITVPRK